MEFSSNTCHTQRIQQEARHSILVQQAYSRDGSRRGAFCWKYANLAGTRSYYRSLIEDAFSMSPCVCSEYLSLCKIMSDTGSNDVYLFYVYPIYVPELSDYLFPESVCFLVLELLRNLAAIGARFSALSKLTF